MTLIRYARALVQATPPWITMVVLSIFIAACNGGPGPKY